MGKGRLGEDVIVIEILKDEPQVEDFIVLEIGNDDQQDDDFIVIEMLDDEQCSEEETSEEAINRFISTKENNFMPYGDSQGGNTNFHSPKKPDDNLDLPTKNDSKSLTISPEPRNTPQTLETSKKQMNLGSQGKLEIELIPNKLADAIRNLSYIYNWRNALCLYIGPGYKMLFEETETIKRLKSIIDRKCWEDISHYNWKTCRQILLTDPDIELNDSDMNKYRDRFLGIFANGIVEDSPKRVKKSKPEYMIFTHCSMEYHPESRHNHNGVFDNFLNYISGGDIEIENLIVSAMGAMLLPSASFKKAFMLLGERNSGKSVICWILCQIIGDDNVQNIDIQKLDKEFKMRELLGAYANICADGSKDRITATQMSLFKGLVSGGLDTMNVSVKYARDAKLHTDAIKLLFAYNKYPLIEQSDDLDAYLERWIIIPFRHTIPYERQDKSLRYKLLDEKDYIIYRALKASKELRENNYIFPECEASQQALEEYRIACSKTQFPSFHETLDMFVKDKCILDVSCKEHTSILYDAYVLYCDECCEKPMTKDKFKDYLCENYFLTKTNKFRKDGRNTYGLAGIKLR